MPDQRRTGGLLAIEGVPVAIVLLAIIGVFMLTAPNSFQSPRIYLSFLATVPPPLIVGLGLTLVIAAGGLRVERERHELAQHREHDARHLDH